VERARQSGLEDHFGEFEVFFAEGWVFRSPRGSGFGAAAAAGFGTGAAFFGGGWLGFGRRREEGEGYFVEDSSEGLCAGEDVVCVAGEEGACALVFGLLGGECMGCRKECGGY